MTLLGLSMTAGCGETPTEPVGSAYVDEVKISGFRLSDRYQRAEDTVLTFVGPSRTDLADAVTAPGFDFRGSSPSSPTSGPLFEFLAEAYGIKFRDMKCRVGIARLKAGVDPLETMHLTAEEAASVRNSSSVVLEVTVGCSQPAP